MTYNSEKNTAYIKANVPKDRLEQYTKDIKSETIRDFAEWLEECGLLTLWQGDYCESLSAEKVLEMYKEQK